MAYSIRIVEYPYMLAAWDGLDGAYL
jgi:hypothetical protein